MPTCHGQQLEIVEISLTPCVKEEPSVPTCRVSMTNTSSPKDSADRLKVLQILTTVMEAAEIKMKMRVSKQCGRVAAR